VVQAAQVLQYESQVNKNKWSWFIKRATQNEHLLINTQEFILPTDVQYCLCGLQLHDL
jgi:hypothetical protein